MARVAAQYAYMVSSDFESPEARYALGPYTPVDPPSLGLGLRLGLGLGLRLGLQPGTTVARVAAQYAYMVSSDFESPEARYALGPYTPVDPFLVY